MFLLWISSLFQVRYFPSVEPVRQCSISSWKRVSRDVVREEVREGSEGSSRVLGIEGTGVSIVSKTRRWFPFLTHHTEFTFPSPPLSLLCSLLLSLLLPLPGFRVQLGDSSLSLSHIFLFQSSTVSFIQLTHLQQR